MPDDMMGDRILRHRTQGFHDGALPGIIRPCEHRHPWAELQFGVFMGHVVFDFEAFDHLKRLFWMTT
jgi:hypothetical protein